MVEEGGSKATIEVRLTTSVLTIAQRSVVARWEGVRVKGGEGYEWVVVVWGVGSSGVGEEEEEGGGEEGGEGIRTDLTPVVETSKPRRKFISSERMRSW